MPQPVTIKPPPNETLIQQGPHIVDTILLIMGIALAVWLIYWAAEKNSGGIMNIFSGGGLGDGDAKVDSSSLMLFVFLGIIFAMLFGLFMLLSKFFS